MSLAQSTPWSVRRQLLVTFGVVSAVIVALAVGTFAALKQIDQRLYRIADRLYPQSMRLANTDVTLVRASLEARHAMLARTPEEREQTLARIGELRAKLDAELAEFERNIRTDEGRRRFAEVRRTSSEFWTVAGQLVPLIQAGDTPAAMGMLVDRVVPARDAFLAALDHQQAWQTELVRTVTAEAIDRTTRVEAALLACAVLAVVAGVLVSLWVSRRFQRALGGEPHEAVAAMRAIAAGDLTRPVHNRGGSADSVMAALAQMRESLTTLVSEVRRSVDSVTVASQQIAEGNADLSRGTETQAAGVQQAASAMAQMTESVRTNADGARQASALTAGANAAAGRGGEVVRQVVATMGTIQDASRRIADITATIDGIAFQTNILALNAAVEAARAGEQGRGFAVVAAEVRGLARRSAEAAREVKALIADSVEKVEAGHGLAGQAGQAMDDIVAQVSRVDALIAEIATASHEQSRGIVAVGDTVQQIDASTQQNAALVEQSAAAAESLRRQAEQLRQTVGAFRTPHEPVAS